MQEEPNPVKDYLFDYLSKSEVQIQKLISDKKFSEIIDEVIANLVLFLKLPRVEQA